MRYRLRTLLIVLALGPPVLAGFAWMWMHEPVLLLVSASLLSMVGLFALWMIV